MTCSARVQLSRKKGQPQVPAGAVRVDRKSEFGKPFKILEAAGGWLVEDNGGAWRFPTKPEAVLAAVGLYRRWLAQPSNRLLRNRMRLVFRDKRPACWCRLDGGPCHADVILEIARSPME